MSGLRPFSGLNVMSNVPFPIRPFCVDSGKKARPGSFVRVNVDTTNFCLRMAWRAKTETSWTNHPDAIPLPSAALDIKARKAPDNIVLTNLPTTPPESMDCNSASTTDVNSTTVAPLGGVRPSTCSATRSPKGTNTPKK